MGKNVIIFGADMRWNVNIADKNKDVSILGQGPIQGLDEAILNAEAIYPVNFTQPKEIVSCYNASNSFIFVNATKIYQFKEKNSKIKNYTLCLVNILKDFTNNVKQTALKGIVKIVCLLTLILLILAVF